MAKELDMADNFERDNHIRYITGLVEKKDMVSIAGNICHELWRIAAAQEAIVEMAKADLEVQIEEAVKSRAEKLAAELDADKTKRTYIGRKS